MKIIETEKYTKYISDDEKYVISNGYLTGYEIVVPNTANIPKESFAPIPVELLPNDELFSENSEYADGGMWDNVQKRGLQKDMSYAFANWGASKMIIPKWPLLDIDECMYALKDCSELVDARNLVFHITNENPSMLYVCANCSKMVYAPRFVFYNAPIIRNYMSMYAGCLKLKEVYVHWGDGSTDPIAERSSCQNMFFKCAMLEDIHFTGKGSPIHLDLSYSKYISYSTMLSLAESLMPIDVVEMTNRRSKHEITISSTTAAMFRGEIAVTKDDIITDEVPGLTTESLWETKNVTQIIPYLDSMEYIKNISFNLDITPTESQDETKDIYAVLVRNGEIFYQFPINALNSSVSVSMMSEDSSTEETTWVKIFEKEDLKDGIGIILVDFTGNSSIKVSDLKYTYVDNTSLITSKGWTILEEEKADNVIM